MLHRRIPAAWLAGWLTMSLTQAAVAAAPESTALPSIADKTRSLRPMPGFLPLYWDAQNGKLYLEIPRINEDMLYVDSLPYGAGSNDLGLDRGQTSDGRIVRFERFGRRVLLVQPGEQFRASSTEAAEQLAVRQSFAESVIAGFDIEAQSPDAGMNAAVLVDATAFFQRDAHEVAETLARTEKDGYKLDPQRSVIAIEASRAFPKNIEVEALLTFTSEKPAASGFVRDVAPDPHALTVRERQSFMELPGPGFTPRHFDPRAGFFQVAYRDYTAPLGTPLDRAFIVRHRLVRRDPACTAACVAEQPIQYYVDRGAPEPIRSALLEGARWWDQAFQAAGWAPGTFRVDLLPEGADPMDLRYNIIQWVHRFTRGWSYGHAIADPRTGEIIKGTVTLGSLRGRQDYLIAEALLSPYATGRKIDADNDPMLKLVLARLRQLAAHETGHTLGLMHNFGASAIAHPADRTVSVMDYPFPWITLGPDGVPDIAHAYGAGIGEWDKVAIDYGYRQFTPNVDEHAELDRILGSSAKAGLLYMTDDDARPSGSAHPYAHLWDNGTDPADELARLTLLRSAALTRFGEDAIRPGVPVAQLQDTLVPLYLLHRYQTEAVIKEIGGLDYRYQLRGDGQAGPQVVAAAQQRRALAAVLKTLSADFLTLPESLLRQLPPRPPGLDRTRESPPSKTGLTFDPVASAECSADLTLRSLFNPERAARLMEYAARDPAALSLPAVIDATLDATRPRGAGAPGAMAGLIQDAVYVRTVEALLALGADPKAAAAVRAVVFEKVSALSTGKAARTPTGSFVARRIEQWSREPDKFAVSAPVEAPPGMPIGDQED